MINGLSRIEFSSDGFREILLSSGVKDLVSSQAEVIKNRANGNLTEESDAFEADTFRGNYGGGRWIGVVSTTDYASQKAEAEDKALSKAVI